eukprot:m.16723 g.16723  ORF g.16723 m.16723 type:complete len:278 (+) comp28602_c0_seq1:333-1166(+)
MMKLAIVVAACVLAAAALHSSGWTEIEGGKTLLDGCLEAGGNTWNYRGERTIKNSVNLNSLLTFLGYSNCQKKRIKAGANLIEFFADAFTKPTTPNALACCLAEGCELPDGSSVGNHLPSRPADTWSVVMFSAGLEHPLRINVQVPSLGCDTIEEGFCQDGPEEVATTHDDDPVFPEYRGAHIQDPSGTLSFNIQATLPISGDPVLFTIFSAVVTVTNPNGQITHTIHLSDVLADPTQLANAMSTEPVFSIWDIGTITFAAGGSTFTATNALSIPEN